MRQDEDAIGSAATIPYHDARDSGYGSWLEGARSNLLVLGMDRTWGV